MPHVPAIRRLTILLETYTAVLAEMRRPGSPDLKHVSRLLQGVYGRWPYLITFSTFPVFASTTIIRPPLLPSALEKLMYHVA